MILVVTEHQSGVWHKMSWEALAAGQAMGQALGRPVTAAVLGDAAEADVAGHGVERVFSLRHPLLADYTPDGYTVALRQLIAEVKPYLVVLPHTYQVRDFAPKVAARLGREVVGDCIRYKAENDKLVLTRRIFLGKLDADVTIGGDAPYFVTFQSGAFRGDNAAKGTAAFETMDVNVGEIRMRPEEPFQEAKASVDLTKSEIIVAVGRGIKSQENIAIAQQLADVLGADLAASRPICDSDWLPIDRQIGSSGQTVAPKLYIALGISGAIQHIVGMKNAGTIVAVNKDAEAPIFDLADYGIVGDLFEAVPIMVEEIKKAKG